jgi:2,4-dienoyl-CoA reductase-like NADH-dependent reductase (Old Yellow Enzyme family)
MMDKAKKFLLERHSEDKLSRRDFLRYSSAVLSAAAIPGLIGCAGVQIKQDCQKHILTGKNRNYEKVFSSSMMGKIRMDNRIIRSSTTMGMASQQGRPTVELAAAYTEMAAGGVGMIITGGTAVQQNGKLPISTALVLDRDDYIPDYKMLVEAAHTHNVPIVLQATHAGRQTRRAITGKQPVAPSPITDKMYDEEEPRELSELEIREIIQNFINTTERAQKAGFDGVQICGAHGTLLSAFLSLDTNRREDKWGGSLENRFRMMREIFTGARKRLGDFPLFIKLSAYDFQGDGLRVEETVKVAAMLEESGCDGIEVSSGVANDGFSTIRVPEIPFEAILHFNHKFKDKPGIVKAIVPVFAPLLIGRPEPLYNYNVCAAREIKQAVDIPVIVVGGIRNLPDIEQIIGGNMADYVAMSRPFIIEPGIVNKFKTKSQEKSKCINCGFCLIALEELPAECFYGEIPS